MMITVSWLRLMLSCFCSVSIFLAGNHKKWIKLNLIIVYIILTLPSHLSIFFTTIINPILFKVGRVDFCPFKAMFYLARFCKMPCKRICLCHANNAGLKISFKKLLIFHGLGGPKWNTSTNFKTKEWAMAGLAGKTVNERLNEKQRWVPKKGGKASSGYVERAETACSRWKVQENS